MPVSKYLFVVITNLVRNHARRIFDTTGTILDNYLISRIIKSSILVKRPFCFQAFVIWGFCLLGLRRRAAVEIEQQPLEHCEQ